MDAPSSPYPYRPQPGQGNDAPSDESRSNEPPQRSSW
jgi:hypothetical protein